MESYENYQYMRALMWPAYERAGLPEALLFGILATESAGKVHAVSRAGAADELASDHTVATLAEAALLHAGRPTVVTVGVGAQRVAASTEALRQSGIPGRAKTLGLEKHQGGCPTPAN